MFELARESGAAALTRPSSHYEPLSGVVGMSMLFWGEHCIECAAPACFATCSLYQPRFDGRCRRFVEGQRCNPAYPSMRGYGVEVKFKKWGKLETRGNTRLLPLQKALRAERLIRGATRVLNHVGPVMGRVTHDERWRDITMRASDRVVRRLHRDGTPTRAARPRPDAFVLEVYNPGNKAVRLHIVMTIAKKEIRRELGPRALLPSCRR